MRRILSSALLAALTASSMLSPATAYSQDDMVSLDDVLLLVQNDISDQTILTFLKYRKLDFPLDAIAMQRLREGSVSETVIRSLLEPDDAPTAAIRTYVVPTGYSTGYPSYYYGARLIGTTAFPLSWYNNHYFVSGHGTAYGHVLSYSEGHSPGHSADMAFGHVPGPIHATGIHGGNHPIDHGARSPGHSSRYGVGHSLRHHRGH